MLLVWVVVVSVVELICVVRLCLLGVLNKLVKVWLCIVCNVLLSVGFL